MLLVNEQKDQKFIEKLGLAPKFQTTSALSYSATLPSWTSLSQMETKGRFANTAMLLAVLL
jgi:hypothetical protein